jgi:hypothetical protein
MNDAFRGILLPGLVLTALLALPGVAGAVPFVPDFSDGPVVFDFEDGLQGWTASGSVERVATDALGGEWALFGEGRFSEYIVEPGIVLAVLDSAISLEIDLSEVGWLELDQLYLGEAASGTDFIGTLVVFSVIPGVVIGSIDPLESPDPLANPGRRRLDLRARSGVEELVLVWSCYECPDPLNPPSDIEGVGYIDNITLIPLPEPRPIALTGAALLILGVARLASRRAAPTRS